MTIVVQATDNFNRANEAPLSGGGNWTDGQGGASLFNLTSNVAVPITDSDRQAIYQGRVWDKDQTSQAKMTVTGTGGGGSGGALWVRCTNPGGSLGGYRLAFDHAASTNWALRRVVGSAFTAILNFTQAWTNGDTVLLTVQGPAHVALVKIFLNGTLIQSVTDTGGVAIPGAPGIGHSSSATTSIDDWEGGEIVADTPPVNATPAVAWWGA